jgi:hypothetical protein
MRHDREDSMPATIARHASKSTADRRTRFTFGEKVAGAFTAEAFLRNEDFQELTEESVRTVLRSPGRDVHPVVRAHIVSALAAQLVAGRPGRRHLPDSRSAPIRLHYRQHGHQRPMPRHGTASFADQEVPVPVSVGQEHGFALADGTEAGPLTGTRHPVRCDSCVVQEMHLVRATSPRSPAQTCYTAGDCFRPNSRLARPPSAAKYQCK